LSLMRPKTHQGFLIVQEVILNRQNALEHFAQVSQVECVMRLGRSWKQFSSDLLINLQRGLHN
jgi:hypothetical protein